MTPDIPFNIFGCEEKIPLAAPLFSRNSILGDSFLFHPSCIASTVFISSPDLVKCSFRCFPLRELLKYSFKNLSPAIINITIMNFQNLVLTLILKRKVILTSLQVHILLAMTLSSLFMILHVMTMKRLNKLEKFQESIVMEKKTILMCMNMLMD